MAQKNENLSIQLQKPGAGIPLLHELFLKYFIGPFVAARTPWAVSEIRFNKINRRILDEVASIDAKQLNTKILIPPQMGLEDSSRFWSVTMTVEHLLIVGELMFKVIDSLCREKIPEIHVSIADVKPGGVIPSQEVMTEFALFVNEDVKKLLINLKNRDSALKFKHPWFGEINAKQWFWVMTTHHALHLKQIREIKKRLSVV